MPRSSEKSKYSQSESKVTAKSEQSARPQQTPHFSSQGENSASGWDEMTHAMVDPTDLRLGLPPRENPISFTDPNGLRNRAWSQSQLNLPLSEPLRSGSQSAESSENSFISDPFQMGNAGGDPMRQSQEFNARCARADSAIPRRPLPPSSHIFQAARRGDSQFSTLARRGSDQDFSPQPHSRRISSRGGTPLSPVKEASEAAERDSPRK
ncbi:hypothetical protein L228DRAFT_245124 [Xylona heveae TC161]|uniref:Uncharacterized protein n=1 Tax=Xylona heveae (strain CBS 132557 / TC161) TaxID=1328760 RepID=A0A165I1I9_XYLHT|nr:hypothetical protein L228DRAFT_245124 [Xylona heveae TC161]KZF24225.1 hypothetical protein L228DRAFT_245124 [Xylona heveae TC161]